jgi:hypothetical protein
MSAWLEYDPNTLVIKKVSWKKSNNTCVEIDDNIAEDFIYGKKNFSTWAISIDSGQPFLSEIKNSNTRTYFISQLKTINSNTVIGCNIFIDVHGIILSNITDTYSFLFVTKKDDPSWLIQTINLKEIVSDADGKINLVITNAESYSYFLGR